MKQTIIYILILTTNLIAMDCSNYSNFTKYNNKFYSMSTEKLTFESARQIAINNGGKLAVPNDKEENDFIEGLIGGASHGWIGIHDPNKIENYCFGNVDCAYDNTRFKDIDNNSILYKNFNQFQPDNLVKQYDVVDGKSMVSPIGEFWVVMNGNNGKWYDEGNHADNFNNPVKYKAVFEFEDLNDCTPPSDDDEQDLSGRFCNTKVWDETVDIVTMGKTVDCLNDSYGNEYCPEALAKAGEYWTYDDGWSIEKVGIVTDYTNKVEQSVGSPIESPAKAVFKVVSGSVVVNNGTRLNTGAIFGNRTGARIGLTEKTQGTWFYQGTSSCPYVINLITGTLSKSLNIGERRNVYGVTFESTPAVIECGFDGTKKICPTGSFLRGNECISEIKSCPIGFTPTSGSETVKGECKKTASYTYYKYLCKNEQNDQLKNYSPTISTTFIQKTDADNTNDNSSSLDDTVGSATPPVNNCKRKEFTCDSTFRVPVWVNNEWQCSPFPCLGTSNLEKLNTDIGKNDNKNDGWDEDGSCAGEIGIFTGKSKSCRSWDMFLGLAGGGCCDKDKVALGLIPCKADEKLLAKKRQKKHTVKVGNYCSKELKLGFTKICVQKSDSYCSFNSKLSRIINEQGRTQIGKGWGSGETPDCSGFTPEEFQKLDFSQIDLTEFIADIQANVKTDVFNNLGDFVKDSVEGFYEEK